MAVGASIKLTTHTVRWCTNGAFVWTTTKHYLFFRLKVFFFFFLVFHPSFFIPFSRSHTLFVVGFFFVVIWERCRRCHTAIAICHRRRDIKAEILSLFCATENINNNKKKTTAQKRNQYSIKVRWTEKIKIRLSKRPILGVCMCGLFSLYFFLTPVVVRWTS